MSREIRDERNLQPKRKREAASYTITQSQLELAVFESMSRDICCQRARSGLEKVGDVLVGELDDSDAGRV